MTVSNTSSAQAFSIAPVTLNPTVRDLGFTILVGTWMAALGPFNNYGAGPLTTRVVFHVLLALISLAVFRAAVAASSRLANRLKGSPLFFGLAALGLCCLPLSGVAGAVGNLFFPHLRYILSPLDWIIETTVLDLPIACGYAGVIYFLTGKSMISGKAVEVCPPQRRNSLYSNGVLAGVPIRTIQAIEVEDHYIRIHTDGRSTLVLMPFHKAIEVMRGVDGIKVHRSWWIALRAANDIKLNSRGGLITLRNGVQVPVARRSVALVRMADLKSNTYFA